MQYIIKTHDGKELAIKQNDPEVIALLAKKLELIAVTLKNGKITYLSKGTVARLEVMEYTEADIIKQSNRIEPPDYRGRNSAEKEKVRAMLKNKGLL
jgi:hypothetical protein